MADNQRTSRLQHPCSHLVRDVIALNRELAQSKHPSDKIIEIIHPTTATSTQGKVTTGKGGNLVWAGSIYSSSSFFFDLLGRSC